MIRYRDISTAAVMLCILAIFVGTVVRTSFAEEVKTVEWYLDQARPHLHHSCQSAWDSVEQDEDRFVDLIGTISAVSFYNHNFDIERLTALPEEKQKALQRAFYEDIGRRCREDNEALLAGVIDHSLSVTIAKVVVEEQQQ